MRLPFADSDLILLADSARWEIPSRCCVMASLMLWASSDESDLSLVPVRLAFRDFGDGGLA